MSVSLTYGLTATGVETLETNVFALGANTKRQVTIDALNQSLSLNASSTPPVTKVAFGEVSLSAGAATLDLTSLTGVNGKTVSLSGLKVQIIVLVNKSTNANSMSFTEGAVNGYALAGASWLLALQPGQHFCMYGADATPDVAVADLAIAVTGTGTQTFQYLIYAG